MSNSHCLSVGDGGTRDGGTGDGGTGEGGGGDDEKLGESFGE